MKSYIDLCLRNHYTDNAKAVFPPGAALCVKEDEMAKLAIKDHEKFVKGFLEEYLADGMGVMSKREVDILVMNLLMKYGGLANKRNHELSLLLQTPESRIKSLRYEARLKYPPDKDYIKVEFLCLLARSQFELDKKDEDDINKMKIMFVLEDDYLRHAIQGYLKERGMFADTSFNSEIVKIECGSLVTVIGELYGSKVAGEFLDGFKTLKPPKKGGGAGTYGELIVKFVLDTAGSIFSAVVVGEIKTRLGIG